MLKKTYSLKSKILKKSAFVCVHLWIIALCLFALPHSTKAQVRPVYDYGAIGLGQLLKRLNNTKSVMHIGAHPDDEDSGLLAYLARGENARTAYLSLTRGDGGQNIIGSELFESLGVIRTEELLQARRLDGAEQFFTRAFDFGFSKTLAETKAKWDEKIILCDAVRAIRIFRPLVVISRFAGTPADGHGQHQYAGYIAPIAVKAAADANQCKDSGSPWQVLKFYVSQGFRSTEKPTLSINTGQYDPLLGHSYFEIAMEGRSQHKTQEQGVLELKGERLSGLNLIESVVPKVENEKSIFDGIDTTISGISRIAKLPDLFYNSDFLNIQSVIQGLSSSFENQIRNNGPVISVSTLQILQLERKSLQNKLKIDDGTRSKDILIESLEEGIRLLKQKEQEVAEITRASAGIQIDALADKETVTPDESFPVTTRVYFPNSLTIKVKEINLQTPNGWQVSKADAPKDTNQGFFRREVANETAYFNVKVPKDAKLTEPFWLENPRRGDLFDLPNGDNLIESFQKPLIYAAVKIEIAGTEITFDQPVEYRFADDIRGEVRRDVNVVPKLSLSLDQNLLIVPNSGKAQTRRINLSIMNNSSSEMNGEAKLNLPKELKISPSSTIFNLKKKGEKTTLSFDITIPANVKISDFDVRAQATANGETFNQTMHTLAYPHINTHRFYTDAAAKIKSFDLKIAPVKVGYVSGSGDAVAEAIRQMGLAVEMLDEKDLNGDLSKYDVIVAGIRAFQVRGDLIENNQRVLDYVKNGGKLIVQYQRPEYESLLPFPAKLGARVVDENAKVTILDQNNPVFNFPNKITDSDFAGWVQERNLYAFTTFDANYQPLLEAHDVNEPENKGGLVVADLGKGKYVYCSYAFFRQLPAGVPGAYRLFANLLSLK